jgi:hypothetical protein
MACILKNYRYQLTDIPNKILIIDDNENDLSRLIVGEDMTVKHWNI